MIYCLQSTYIIEIPLTFLFFAPTSSLRKFTALCQLLLMVRARTTKQCSYFYLLHISR